VVLVAGRVAAVPVGSAPLKAEATQLKASAKGGMPAFDAAGAQLAAAS
jgi:hypothetical protein